MEKIVITVLLILLSYISTVAQITVSGYVSDNESGERLIGANVFDKKTKKGTVTNSFGFYSLRLTKSDTIILSVSYIGYKKKEIIVKKNESKTLNISLVQGNQIKEVKVTAKLNIEDRAEIGVISLPINKIKELPAIGGEPDIMKALQLMPGVQSGNEGSSGLYVRGGSPDQNLMLLDDVPLYYVNHLGGFVSTFNIDALSNVSLIKGGFPARYGSRLSSIVDIRMKDGDMKNFKAAGTLGLISSKLMIEGPIKKDTISYLISYRRFLYDLIMRPLSKMLFDGYTTAYYFYDFNAKINYKINRNNRLYLSFYSGDDKLLAKINKREDGQKSKNTNQWGNLLGALRWNHVFNPVLFANTTLTYTQYRYKMLNSFEQDEINNKNTFLSAINDIGAKFDIEYYPFNALKIRAGVNGIIHKYTPTSTSYQKKNNGTTFIDTTYNQFSEQAYEWNAYIENEFNISKYFMANVGLRYSSYAINDTVFSSFEPRLIFNIKVAKHSSIKLAYSKMQQYVHLLSSSGAGMAADYWVPSTSVLHPEKSTQYSFGFVHTNNMYEFSVESYYKTMNNLITFTEGVGYLSGSGNWQNKVDNNGTGLSYGAELYIKKNTGKITGWLSYSLSKTTRQFANQNNGKEYPYKFDRRHDISISATYKINENVNFGATWVYGTGNAITLATSHHYLIDDNEDFLDGSTNLLNLYDGYSYGEKNSFRMRSYHRLDIGFNFVKKKKWGERTWNLSIYNVYNRQNPYFYVWDQEDNSSNSNLKLYQQSLFPFMPSVSYSFKF